MRRNQCHRSPLMKPTVRWSRALLKAQTIDHDGGRTRWDSQIDEHGGALTAPGHLKYTKDAAGSWDKEMPRLLSQASKNRLQNGILEFLGKNGSPQTLKSAGEAKPFEVAVVIAGDNYVFARL